MCEKPGKNSDTDDETRAAGECGIPPAPGKAVLFADGKQKRTLVLRMTQKEQVARITLEFGLAALAGLGAPAQDTAGIGDGKDGISSLFERRIKCNQT